MTRARLHPQGPEFSRLVAGTWKWSTQEINERMIHTALEQGITTFDHADIYGGYTIEALFGNVLKKNPALRSQMELITKCGIALVNTNRPNHYVKHYNTSYKHLVASVDQSLQNFGTEYIDLLLLHRPDPLMRGEEIAEAFHELKRSGKVLYFGVSNFTAHQFDLLQSFFSMPLVTNQIEVSLFKNTFLFDGLADMLQTHRVSPMAWSPLGSGKFFSNLEQMQALQSIADRYNATLPQLLFAWLIVHPSHIFPITGTTKPERLQEAAGSFSLSLKKQDWFAMLKIVTGKDVA